MRRNNWASLVLVVFAGGGSVTAAGVFDIPQAMSAPFASDLVAAPVGAKVAWLENEQGKRNVWVAAAPDWKARPLTNFTKDDGQDISDLTWGPDGNYLLFARGGDFENGGENPNPDLNPAKPDQSIWYAAMDGPVLKKLTEGRAPAIAPRGETVAFLRGGQIFLMKPGGEDVRSALTQKGTQGHLRWSPDGNTLAFVSTRAEHSFIGLYSLGDRTLRYLDPSVDRDVDAEWSADGSAIAYIRLPANARGGFGARREGSPWSIRVTDLRTGACHRVFEASEGQGSVFHEIVGAQQIYWNGDRLVFPWEQSGWIHLYSIAISGGKATDLTPGEGEVEHVSASHDGGTIYFAGNFDDIDRRHIWSVDAQGGSPPKAVTRGESLEWSPTPVANGSVMAFLTAGYNSRSHAALRVADGTVRDLAAEIVPKEFPAASFVKPEAVIVTAADGMQIHAQLFLPPHGRAGERHPALVFFHGGSRRQMLLGWHYMYYYSNAYAMNQYLANQGYVVLSVNYRSGIGYGLNFREALNYGVRGASEYNDVVGAGLFLKARADVDPHRIGVWGGSYGGYLTAMALARGSDLFAAGVDFHGVHDWSTLRGYGAEAVGGDPKMLQEQRETARIAFESSPMASVDGWKSPVLLIHGDDDRNVEFSQTEELVDALRKRHVEFEQLIFPNEIHDFLLYKDWVQAYEATAEFFARKLHLSANAALTH